MSEDQPSVEYHYLVDPAYRMVPANTVYTSLTQNEIKIDFGMESLAIPSSLKHPVVNGVIAEEVIDRTGTQFVRTILVGVVIPLNQAEKIARHILNQIEGFRTANK